QAAEFIKEYKRRARLDSGGPNRTGVARGRRTDGGVLPGEEGLQLGADGDRKAVGGAESVRAGNTAAPLRAVGSEQVPAEYRDLLEAYYRSMAKEGRTAVP